MRYQDLRAARETLEHAITYLINNPKQITVLIKKVDQSAVLVLREALHEVREELKHPEHFRLYESEMQSLISFLKTRV